jgi:hypothetical protein
MLAKPILLEKPVEGRSPVSLSVTEVRAIVLRSQRLAEDLLPFGLGKTAVLKAIQHLGYIQVDPINVLQRAHHHVHFRQSLLGCGERSAPGERGCFPILDSAPAIFWPGFAREFPLFQLVSERAHVQFDFSN